MVQIECHEHENYHNHGFSMLCKKMELKKHYNPITQHNNIKQINETCQNNFMSPTYFLVDIFDMLETKCFNKRS
jgi:hypothetical protein